MGPLSDASAGYGRSQLDGVTLASEEVNARADDWHLRVELVALDDHSDMSGAGDRLVDLVYEQRVHAIIGAIHSAVTHVVQLISTKSHVPFITTTSTDPSITRSGNFYAFRCLADDLLQGRALAHQLFEVDGRKRVALLRQNNRYGKMGGAEMARLGRERGTPMVVDLFFDGAATSFPVEIEALKAAGPDALVVWSLYAPGATLLKAVRAAGLKVPVYGADGLVHPEFLRQAGPAAEGTIVTLPFNPCRPDPLTQAFLARFRERFGYEADSFAAHSYDALQLIVAAARRGACVDRECLKDNLLLTKLHPGVTGLITFDQTGNDTREVELARVVEGRLQPLATGTPAAAAATSAADRRSSGWVSCSAVGDNQ